MMLTENIRQAYNSLKINAKRTALTMIGIVIGLSSVLFITSIGDTLVTVLDEFLVQMMGGVSVMFVSGYDGNSFSDNMDKYKLSLDEVYDFIDSADGKIIDIVIPGGVGDISGTINIDNIHKSEVSVVECSSSQEYTDKIRILAGRFFNTEECRMKKPVAVISDIAAEECFGSVDDAIGKMIDMSGLVSTFMDFNEETGQPVYDEKAISSSMVVVGVYEYVNTGTMDMLMNGVKTTGTKLYCPYSFSDEQFGNVSFLDDDGKTAIFQFVVKDRKDIAATENLIAEFAESKFGSDPDYKFYIQNTVDAMKQINNVIKIVAYAFSIIGAISLLVGGIGLMNTMLVSVTERTKEIGIKKALGAKTSTIRLQFLTESAFICLASCAIGVFFGFLFGLIVESNMDKLTALVKDDGLRYFLENINIHVTPSLSSIIFSSLFSVFVGVVFGYYPANKGAKMQPVDALRYE